MSTQIRERQCYPGVARHWVVFAGVVLLAVGLLSSNASSHTTASTQPTTSRGQGGGGWSATAKALRGRNGERFSFSCPGGGSPHTVYGTGVYTDDSSVCTAAVHAGRITLARGGTVKIEIRPGQSSYRGSTRNGITTSSWDSWSGSFVIMGAQAERPAAALPSARLAGEFSVATKITSVSNFSSKRGEKDEGSWKFTPLCSKGACHTRLSYPVGGLITRSNEVKIQLVRSGAVYEGHVRAELSQCFTEDVTGDLAIRLQVTKGLWVNGVWRALRVVGTSRYSTPETRAGGIYRCPGGLLVSSIDGWLAGE